MIYAIAIAAVAWRLRMLDLGGAVAAAILGSVVWQVGGLAMAIPLLAFFLSCSLLGKLSGGAVSEGPRTAGQVLANGGVAGIAAALVWRNVPAAETAYVAALCAANADTWATEIGSRFGRRPVRITTFKPARAGSSGAVTFAGILAAAAGAALVAVSAYPLQGTALPLAAAAGFAGAIVDSVLGDTVQAKFWSPTGESESGGTVVRGIRWLRNNEVNFLMTAFAALAAYLLGR